MYLVEDGVPSDSGLRSTLGSQLECEYVCVFGMSPGREERSTGLVEVRVPSGSGLRSTLGSQLECGYVCVFGMSPGREERSMGLVED